MKGAKDFLVEILHQNVGNTTFVLDKIYTKQVGQTNKLKIVNNKTAQINHIFDNQTTEQH